MFDNQFLSRRELPLFRIRLSCADYRVVANVFRVRKLTVKKFVSCFCRGAVSSVMHQLIKAAKRERSLCHWLSQMFLLQACVEHAHPIPIALSGRPHHTTRIQLQLSGCSRTEQIIHVFSKCGVNAVVVSSVRTGGSGKQAVCFS